MNEIRVANLSTGDESLLTMETTVLLASAELIVLRTARHPIARWLDKHNRQYQSLDDLYEACEDFDAFNQAAAVKLLDLAREREVCYGVTDASFETTVSTLQRLKPRDARVTVLPGVSHADRCLALLEEKPMGVRLFAAEEFRAARVSPTEPLLLCELHSRVCASDCKLRLMELLPAEAELRFFSGDERGALSVRAVPLCELDRQPAYDHLTAVYVPALALEARKRFDMDDLCAVMRRLRAPGGCPWDREQTHESLLTNLLEESYEFIDAVRQQDVDHMYDELGDVLLQVVFHAEIARQHGEFDSNDVTTAICQKMIERHTHIFGTAKADTYEKVLDNWEAIKRRQRGITSVTQAMNNGSTGLSPMMRASKVQHKAAKVGFDFPDATAALGKVHEEADEVLDCFARGIDPEEELGDLLFSIVNVCRLCGKNPDIALFAAIQKFVGRFQKMEISIKNAGKSIEGLTLAEMDVYWEAEKQ